MTKVATDAKDFVPPAVLAGVRDKDKCSRFALSFFSTLDAAKKRFKSLNERQDAFARYGDHIGEIALQATDGLASEPDDNGHMDLHQNDNIQFANRVSVYHPIER